ncbi:MAG TPA: heparinase II/III family protein, partial [Telluria sp.]|nr:heparinase II/III family protein [Telluria sp.]
WYLPEKAFAPGRYSWRVRPARGGPWSDTRQFEIARSSTVFEVPGNGALRERVLARQRPRSLPPGGGGMDKAERARALRALASEVGGRRRETRPVSDRDWPLATGSRPSAAGHKQNADIRQRVNRSARQMEAAALLYRMTGEGMHLAEAKARGDELASLDPNGPTSFANQDQGTRAVALALAKGFDLLHGDLDPQRRQRWLRVIEARAGQIHANLAGRGGRIDQYPFDSHGAVNLGFLAVVSALTLGEIPAASQWFDFSVRAYINSVYPWSGPEGGFANGTSYGQYTAAYAVQTWDPLAHATGVNLFAKPWSQGFARFFAHFVPPGGAGHVFGDESEIAPDYRHLKAFASRVRTPAASWYAHELPGTEDPLTLLSAAHPLPYKRVRPAAPADAALYPSIGWVAMHSELSDPGRTSVFFKSSPYGSYNHSHGDQNALLLHLGGKPLLTASGSMDFYGSPLFNDWYRATRAHNAVTYDGGRGQLTDGNTINLARNGRITQFSTSRALDFAEGQAAPAYGPELRSAVRRVWYLRGEDVVLVQDLLDARSAHSWEWNMHARAPIRPDRDGGAIIEHEGRAVCITPLSDRMRLAFTDGPPPKRGTREWHAAFVTGSTPRGEMLVLLDVGCKRPRISMSSGNTSRTIVVNEKTISIPK